MFLTKACNQSLGVDTETTLKLLACVPHELELQLGKKVVEQLAVYLEAVLDLIRLGLEQNMLLPACQALLAWTENGKVSLSQINAEIDGSQALLPMLIQLLASKSHAADERVVQTAAHALTASLDVTPAPASASAISFS